MLAERIEEIDWGQVEALRSTGTRFFTVLQFAVLPQIMQLQIGLSMFQLDSNLLASAVVGIVGAGGIGSTIINAFGRYDYDFAMAITMSIIPAILISEYLYVSIRSALWYKQQPFT